MYSPGVSIRYVRSPPGRVPHSNAITDAKNLAKRQPPFGKSSESANSSLSPCLRLVLRSFYLSLFFSLLRLRLSISFGASSFIEIRQDETSSSIFGNECYTRIPVPLFIHQSFDKLRDTPRRREMVFRAGKK